MNSARLVFRPAALCARGSGGPTSTLRQRLFHSSSALSVVHSMKTAEEFKKVVGEKETVFVDCFAEWCGPCKAISPIFEKLSDSAEFKDNVHFVKFDVDELPDLSRELRIRAMPTFFLYKHGEQVHEMVGADPQGLLAALRK